jgi:hypothetical protein
MQATNEILGVKCVMIPLCLESHMYWPGPEAGTLMRGQ